MERGTVLLAYVASDRVVVTMVKPGEAPAAGESVTTSACRNMSDLTAFLQGLLRDRGDPVLVGCAVAGEGEDEAGVFQIVGKGWAIDPKRLRAVLKTPRVHLRSVQMASALGAPRLPAASRQVLCAGVERLGWPLVVIGVESALAAALMIPDDAGGWVASPSLGHLARGKALGPRETALAKALGERGLLNFQQTLSVGGLAHMYQALCEMDGRTPAAIELGDSVAMANLVRMGDDAHAKEAMTVFSGWLGAFARQLVLMGAGRGGVMLSSPFLRTLRDVFDVDEFTRRFRVVNAPDEPVLAEVPVWLARDSMALLGLSTLFSSSDARFATAAVQLLDC